MREVRIMHQQHNYGTMSTSHDVTFEEGSSSQFNSLCDSISTNIYTINTSWKTLDNALKCIGTSRDNHGLRDKIHVTQLSTNQIISVTPQDFNKLKLIVRKGNKSQELQVSKLKETFTEAVSRYYEMQKQVASKMKANFLTITNAESSNADDPSVQQQIQLSKTLAFEQDLLIDRESRIRQIEADVIDVNQIMRELSALVQEQGENIDTIENSIDRAASHVEDGVSELIKASRYQSKRRRKLCVLVIIAVIIISALVAILVTTLKK